MRASGKALAAVIVAIAAVSPTNAAADFGACVAGLKAAAIRAGVDRPIVDRAFDIEAPDETVIRLSKLRTEFTTPIWDYFAFMVDDRRVADGKAMMEQHGDVLRRVEKRFGVNRHVVVAVWGIETDYGRTTGAHFLPHALTSLVCEGGRRRAFWRQQLMAALELVDRGDLKLDELKGSWAGAFGQTQFIPTVYRRLAVDFDGDGRRDLVRSVPDALASTANYLDRAGWKQGRSWMYEVKVPDDYKGPTGRKRRAPLSTWAKRGVVRADGKALEGGARAGLLLPAGPKGPGFLVFPNFDAIWAYNHANSYALAISHLADRLAGYPTLRTEWPTDDPGLSREQRRRLQELLKAKGHDIEVDGRIGPNTRAAIRKAEEDLGLEPTGRAGMEVYRALGGK